MPRFSTRAHDKTGASAQADMQTTSVSDVDPGGESLRRLLVASVGEGTEARRVERFAAWFVLRIELTGLPAWLTSVRPESGW